MFTVFGIDAALPGLGLVAVPSDWALDFSRVRRVTLETTPGPPGPARMGALARDVCRWIKWARGRGQADVWIEGSITNSPDLAYTVRSQLKLAGVIEEYLWRELGVECGTAEQSTARKLLLGKLPKSDRKKAVFAALELLTPTNWDANEYDAFVTANYGLQANGVAYLTLRSDEQRRTPKLAGFCNPAALPKGPNGRNLCRQCGREVTSKKRTFCGPECVEAWKIRTQPSFARRLVHDRDRGVCAKCGLKTSELARELNALPHEQRRARLMALGFGRRTHLWEMDHIVPVAEGGGSCGLENLRTLCVPCHRRATAELRERLSARRTA